MVGPVSGCVPAKISQGVIAMSRKFLRFISHKATMHTAAILVATLALIGGPVAVSSTAQSASASPVSYGVSMDSACQQQYPGQGALSGFWSFTNAYSWFCWRVGGGSLSFGRDGGSITIDATILGGINVGAWCARNHPGYFAVATNGYWVYSWKCWAS